MAAFETDGVDGTARDQPRNVLSTLRPFLPGA